LIAKGVARRDVPQSDQGGDVSREYLFDILSFAALDDHEPADPLAFAGPRVVNRVTLGELAGINSEENQLAGVSVGPQFERERTKLVVVAGLDRDDVVGTRLVALGRRDVQGAGQIINHGVEQRLDGLFLEGRTAENGDGLD